MLIVKKENSAYCKRFYGKRYRGKKTRHIQVQPIPNGKVEDIKQNLKDLLHEDLETVTI